MDEKLKHALSSLGTEILMRQDIERKSVKVYFPQFNKIVEASVGESILDIALRAGVGVRSVCGGKGLCGKCKVLVKGMVEHRLTDKLLLSDEEVSKGYVLACLAKVLGDVEIQIPLKASL